MNTNVGVWAFKYKTNDHNITAKSIFPAKTVPARFGPPWAGSGYQITIAATTQQITTAFRRAIRSSPTWPTCPSPRSSSSAKLCRLFVHDDFAVGYDYTDPNLPPEGQLVHQCMLAWENSNPKGQIRPVLSTIFNSDLFRGNAARHAKGQDSARVHHQRHPRPARQHEWHRSARDLHRRYGRLFHQRLGHFGGNPLNRMGAMVLFDRNDPNGYPEDAPGWISAGTLAERIRWVQTYCMNTNDSSKGDSINGGNKSICNPVALLGYKLPLQNPAGSITNEANVADYLLGIIYPGEGTANLGLYRTAAINFLKTADDGVTSSPLVGLSTAGNPSP